MGKSKKGGKTAEVDDANDSEQQTMNLSDEEANDKVTKKVEKAPKKSKNKKKSESESDVNNDDDEDTKKAVVPLTKREARKIKKARGVDEEEEVPAQTISAFEMLNIEDGDDNIDEEQEDVNAKKSKKKKKEKKLEPDESNAKKDKKKKKKGDDEDWDAILAEYQDDATGSKPSEPEKIDDSKDKKDSKKKPAPPPNVTEEPQANQANQEAASKKKKKKKAGEEVATTSDEPLAETKELIVVDENAAAKKKKGPGKAMVAAMQEALKKKKEEEDRLQREEEETIRLLEEADRVKRERERLEQERKELKKQKERERKERLKAEGKLLTAKQKADKARAEALLKSLRDQGIEVPEIGVKKDTRPSVRSMRGSKQKKGSELQPPMEEKIVNENQQQVDETTKREESNEDEKIAQVDDNVVESKEEIEEIKDAWDVSSSDEDTDENESSKDVKLVEEALESSSSESESDDSSEEESSEDEKVVVTERRREVEKDTPDVRIRKREVLAETKRTTDNLRAAVVCVLGHVDTGKTKILDKLRRTNVQDGEAGGITQQIGATNVPIENIVENTKYVKGAAEVDFRLPGLLIIDTPGHESFSNLRNRGSSLCDIAILVVDIMHGLEPQTIESLNLLKSRKTPFVVALNKIDRLYDWSTMQRKDVQDIIKGQAQNTQNEFDKRLKEVILQFNEQGMNAALFYENKDPRTYVSLVPTSAITGEGMGNLLMLIVQFSQNQLAKRLAYSEQLQATVLEVKAIQGLGTTIDTILVNGKLREGDTMILAGTDGPIVTQIRALLLPHPMKELRVKNTYIEQKEICGAQGVKIAAKELEKAIAGINLQIAQEPDEVEYFKDVITRELKSVLRSIKLSEHGVFVQASTLGSLEALLEFLKNSKIPYAGIRIGPVVKRDVMKASIMLEHQSEYATILAFDVKIERDAQELADNLGVKIFQADIIYHLFDKFTAYRDELKQQKRDQFKSIAVFPCKLKILPQFIFNSRDPIVMGVIVEAGIVKEGTPICVIRKKEENIEVETLGIVSSIESNHKNVPTARKGLEVCIKIDSVPGEAPKMFGRHFDENDMLVSKISRESIDACKDYFRDELVKSDWALMIELKNAFGIF